MHCLSYCRRSCLAMHAAGRRDDKESQSDDRADRMVNERVGTRRLRSDNLELVEKLSGTAGGNRREVRIAKGSLWFSVSLFRFVGSATTKTKRTGQKRKMEASTLARAELRQDAKECCAGTSYQRDAAARREKRL